MENKESIISLYSYKQNEYKLLCEIIKSIIENLLLYEKIHFLSVSSRVKSLESFISKIKRKKYKNPFKEMTDFAGIRIICYIEDDVKSVSKLIEKSFNILENFSVNKKNTLGLDKVGYQSTHYICSLGEKRKNLPEYSKFSNQIFEVQIRTILQHAWAELSHDRNYKSSKGLPIDIQRRFNLISGQLEIADREFNILVNKIDSYKLNVKDMIINKNFDIEINITTLIEFIKYCINFLGIKKIQISNNLDMETVDTLIQEIHDFEISKISELCILITKNFIKLYNLYAKQTTESGFIRDLLMFTDIEKYFKNSWNNHWGGIEKDLKKILLNKYNKDIFNKIENELNANIFFEVPDFAFL